MEITWNAPWLQAVSSSTPKPVCKQFAHDCLCGMHSLAYIEITHWHLLLSSYLGLEGYLFVEFAFACPLQSCLSWAESSPFNTGLKCTLFFYLTGLGSSPEAACCVNTMWPSASHLALADPPKTACIYPCGRKLKTGAHITPHTRIRVTLGVFSQGT